MTSSYEDLMDELGELDVQDDRVLIEWLARTFMQAHDDNVDELPEREEVARFIARERGLLPNPGLSGEPPSHDRGDPELATWLIQRAINLALTAPSVSTGSIWSAPRRTAHAGNSARRRANTLSRHSSSIT